MGSNGSQELVSKFCERAKDKFITNLYLMTNNRLSNHHASIGSDIDVVSTKSKKILIINIIN